MKRKYLLPLLLLMCGWTACLRPSDSALPVSASKPFVNGDLKKALAGQASLKLFNQAFLRLGLDVTVDSGKGYTIFAPTDSAMTAAGLDAATINSLPLDSLRKLITYHIVSAAMDELALQNALTSIKTATLRSDTVFDKSTGYVVSPFTLYVQETGTYFFNGVPVGKGGAMIPASNGNIFPVNAFLHPYLTHNSMYDIISADPDLTMYNAALKLADSVRRDYFDQQYGSSFEDPLLMDTIWLAGPTQIVNLGFLPTVFAPTNKAFEAAGFHTVDDLRKYTLNYERYGFTDDYSGFFFTPMDTLLHLHMIFNQPLANLYYQSIPIEVLYGDLLHPGINNGVLNIYDGRNTPALFSGLDLKLHMQVTFSGEQGRVLMSFNGKTIPVPLDGDGGATHYNFVDRKSVV